MKSELKKKVFAIVAAASRFEGYVEKVTSKDGQPIGERGKRLNDLIDAVSGLSADSREMLEEVTE